jgi:hypothetical protein
MINCFKMTAYNYFLISKKDLLLPRRMCESCKLFLKLCNEFHRIEADLCIRTLLIKTKNQIMKKALSVLVLFMAVLVVSAQTTTITTNAKSSKVSVKSTELQKSITDNVVKDFPGFTIKEAFSVTKGTDVTYEVVITKGTVVETLVYDKEGKFVKKLAPMPVPPKK